MFCYFYFYFLFYLLLLLDENSSNSKNETLILGHTSRLLNDQINDEKENDWRGGRWICLSLVSRDMADWMLLLLVVGFSVISDKYIDGTHALMYYLFHFLSYRSLFSTNSNFTKIV